MTYTIHHLIDNVTFYNNLVEAIAPRAFAEHDRIEEETLSGEREDWNAFEMAVDSNPVIKAHNELKAERDRLEADLLEMAFSLTLNHLRRVNDSDLIGKVWNLRLEADHNIVTRQQVLTRIINTGGQVS